MSRAFLLGAGALVLGCSSLLGLGEFEDGPAGTGGVAGSGTGGTGVTGGAAGTDAGGAAGADGGDAGPDGGGLKTCQPKAGEPLDVLSAVGVLPINDFDHESLRIVNGGLNSQTVHLVMRMTSTSNQRMLVVVSLVESGGLVSIASSNVQPFATEVFVDSGFADAQGLTLVGSHGDELATFSYKLANNGKGVDAAAAPTIAYLPTPAECKSPNGKPNGAAFAWGSSDYAIGCVGSGETSLHLRDGLSTMKLASKSVPDSGPGKQDDLRPSVYTLVAGTHFVGSEGGSLRWGKNQAELATSKQVILQKVPGDSVALFAGRAHGPNMTLLAARIGSALDNATLHAGSLPPAKYGTLANKNPAELPPIYELTKKAEIPMLSKPGQDADFLSTAGPSLLQDKIFFYKLKRDGAPVVLQYEVPRAGTDLVAGAVASPAGALDLVIWVERPTGTWKVLARGLICG